MPSGRIQHRIDPALQRDAEAILHLQGIKPAQAIILFYMEVKRSKGLPFLPSPVTQAEIPNARLRKDLAEAKAGKGLRTFKTKKAFFDSLHALGK
jgi:antitoxin component of RelBE/YafQ-DinJ toxin-antitoxin module